MFQTIVLCLLALGVIGGFVASRVFKRKAYKLATAAPQAEPDLLDDESFGRSRRRQFEPQGNQADDYKEFAGYALVASAVCAVIFLIASYFWMLYKQDPGEAVVLRSVSGEVIDTDATSGFGFKAPWVSDIKFDIRNQRVEMFGGTRSNPEIGPDGAAINAGLTGGANVSLSATVRYSIEPDQVESIYNEYRSEDNLLEREIKPAVRDELRNAAAGYEPYTIKENRSQLALEAEKLLRARWEPIGITIEGVDLGEMLLDEQTEAAISAVNVSRQQVETARNDLDASRIQAETVKVDAQAQADADQIVRCGATTKVVTEIIVGKEVTTTKVIPKEGEACEERLNEQVLTAKYLEVLAQLGADGNMTIVIPNDSGGGLDLQPRIDIPVNGTTAAPSAPAEEPAPED